MTYLMIGKKRNKFTVPGNHEQKGNRQYKYRAVVSEVSSCVGNPVCINYVSINNKYSVQIYFLTTNLILKKKNPLEQKNTLKNEDQCWNVSLNSVYPSSMLREIDSV